MQESGKTYMTEVQLTSICGISFKGLSAKYAYSALKTACNEKSMGKPH